VAVAVCAYGCCSWAMSYGRSTLASVSGFPFPLILLLPLLLLLAIIYGMRRNGFYCKNRVSCLWHKTVSGQYSFHLCTLITTIDCNLSFCRHSLDTPLYYSIGNFHSYSSKCWYIRSFYGPSIYSLTRSAHILIIRSSQLISNKHKVIQNYGQLRSKRCSFQKRICIYG